MSFLVESAKNAKVLIAQAVELSEGKFDMEVFGQKVAEVTANVERDEGVLQSESCLTNVYVAMRLYDVCIEQVSKVRDEDKGKDYSSILEGLQKIRDEFAQWAIARCRTTQGWWYSSA
jgi:GH43 family beta-xylosidase